MLDLSVCPRLLPNTLNSTPDIEFFAERPFSYQWFLALVCRQAGEGGPGSDSRGRRAAKGKVGSGMHSSTTVNTPVQLCQRERPVQSSLTVRLVCTYDHLCERWFMSQSWHALQAVQRQIPAAEAALKHMVCSHIVLFSLQAPARYDTEDTPAAKRPRTSKKFSDE